MVLSVEPGSPQVLGGSINPLLPPPPELKPQLPLGEGAFPLMILPLFTILCLSSPLSSPLHGMSSAGQRGLKWSGSNVRIRLWLRLPHGCHRCLSIASASGASLFSGPLDSNALCVHPGQRSLPPRGAEAGPIRPLLVGHKGGGVLQRGGSMVGADRLNVPAIDTFSH